MSKYIALTIGPIIKTITNTRKTRELWAASYIFSYYMKIVLEELNKKKSKYDVLLPSTHRLGNEPKNGAGIYHDQIYLSVKDGSGISDFKDILSNCLDALASIVSETIKADKSNVTNYLKQYFQLYCIEKEIDSNENIIFEITPLLNTIELQHNFPREEKSKFLEQFFIDINSSAFIEKAFESGIHKAHPKLNVEKFGFDSTVEISTREFGYIKSQQVKDIFENLLIGFLKEHGTLKNFRKRQNSTKSIDEKEFIEKLFSTDSKINFAGQELEFNELFKTYHKYIAIVQADGDNIGSIIKQIGHDTKQLKDFSENLLDFTCEASNIISEYGGSPVYAGGDDLLFFAPVSMIQANREENNHIFDLIQKLDQTFQDKLIGFKQHKPSLSFGVSITYYAFPMGEALNFARHQLFGIAKKIDGKNTVSVHFQKHSGSVMSGIFKLADSSYSHFYKMLKTIKFKNKTTDEEKENLKDDLVLLKSVIYKIRENETLINLIAHSESKLDNFFTNSFNETIHRQEPVKKYFELVKNLIFAVYCYEKDSSKALTQIYSMLRLISFIKGEKE